MWNSSCNMRIRKVLCIFFLLPTIKTNSPNSIHASFQFVPVGSTVRLPCDGYGDHTSAKWLYRGEDTNFETFFHKIKGMVFRRKEMSGNKILKNFDLEIGPFTEQDEGIYVCQVCTQANTCTDGKQISLLPLYEISSASSRMHFIIEGGRLSYSCLHNLSLKVDWTFQTYGENTVTHLNSESTNKTSLVIPDVQPSHAGNYSCWRKTLNGKKHKVLSVSVCVLTAMESSDSPQNCTLYCDADVNPEGKPVIVETDKWNISITGTMQKPKSSVICTLHGRRVQTNISSLADESTTLSDATAHITVNSNPLQAVILISTCTAALLITVALVITVWVRRRRVHADRNSTRGCQMSSGARSSGDEDQTQVIYSVVEVGKHIQQNISTSDVECVYSQIKL